MGHLKIVCETKFHMPVGKTKFYAVKLACAYTNAGITHIDLVVPDASFNGILHRENLLPATDSHFLLLRPEEEEKITALHKDLEELVTLKIKK
mgnify:CR=1 FL=1